MALILLLLITLVLIIFIIKTKAKMLKIDCITLIDGGVKTGKSFLSIKIAISEYKKALFKEWLKNIFRKNKEVLPQLYSNIRLRGVKFSLLTKEIVLRQVRIPNKSICLIDEASLLADSMLYKDTLTNEKLMLFCKLFGHYSHGGKMIINTQCIGDLHFSFKRSLSRYYWIYHRTKLPFVTVLKVRELMYSDDNQQVVNTVNSDVENDLKTLIVLNKYYKKYDCYCYSIFTDELTLYYDSHMLGKNDSLKTDRIISLREFKTLKINENESEV